MLFLQHCGSARKMKDIPFDRQQLADYLCVERSALSAEISRLSKLGLITSRKSHFALRRTVRPPASVAQRSQASSL